ncbi:uncharacterized protein zgc:113208 [Polyodon spathula]|uniref:uncharacterized protein zgc:113208 n=1 Tax=Polyodon spathula TaxID=7913 RepID=UPI001B7F3992|nr:uncharacterized protein zgc:113208 [Polyodon spathula]
MASRVTKLARNAKPVRRDEEGKGIAKKRKAESHQETVSPQKNGVAEKKSMDKEKPEGLNGGTALPVKNKKGELVFEDFPTFRPNMTPMEVLQAGSFGGTYFRPIHSSITKEKYSGVWKELPADWLEGLDIPQQVASEVYREAVNTYKVKCGGSLEMWESSGWIVPQDTYGWFQWYCRFYQGRRTADDSRQVGRWERCAGVKGRWRNNLITKVLRSGCGFDNHTVSPVVRQTLQHWGYRLTQEDYQQGAKRVKPK